MNDANDASVLSADPQGGSLAGPEGEGWSAPSGDLLVPLGDVLGVRLRKEQIGGPIVAVMAELPAIIRTSFKLVDVILGEQSAADPPYLIDRSAFRFGQWIEFGGHVSEHISLAVMCVGRYRPGARPGSRGSVEQQRFRGVIWLRDDSGRLWGEAVGWVGSQALESFSAWCSR